jgi:hypothetical protein
MLKGLKTYAVVGIAILSALLGYFNDQLTMLQALEAIGIAVGLGGNRLVLNAAAILNGPYSRGLTKAGLNGRAWVAYLGTALAILTAIIAGLNGEQDSATTIAAVLGALGLNFLGMGAKKVALGTEPVTAPVRR